MGIIKNYASSLILCVSLFFLISGIAIAENTFVQRTLLLSHQFSVLEMGQVPSPATIKILTTRRPR